MVYQHVSHCAAGQSDDLRVARTFPDRVPGKAVVGLVHEIGGLKRQSDGLPAHLRDGDGVNAVIGKREQRVDSRGFLRILAVFRPNRVAFDRGSYAALCWGGTYGLGISLTHLESSTCCCGRAEIGCRNERIELGTYARGLGLAGEAEAALHLARGIECIACHGDMEAVGDPARNPWVDLPRCGDCHERPGFDFEEPGVLFKDSVGHGGVRCESCHGSPHAVGPAVTATDNVQAMLQQGHAGVINTCSVCHTQMPDKPFFHRRDDD